MAVHIPLKVLDGKDKIKENIINDLNILKINPQYEKMKKLGK